MKILITGGTGYLAWQLVNEFEKENVQIAILSAHPDSAFAEYTGKKIDIIGNEEVLSGTRRIDDIDVVIHTAFCRKSDGELLYDSLHFLEDFSAICIRDGVKGFINISSQSVYGSKEGPLPDEMAKPNPGYLYAFAKLASELLLEQIVHGSNTDMKFTNIRLASLIGPGKFVPDNILSKFIHSALKDEPFRVIGGKQKFSFLDVRDAARAIALFVETDLNIWDKKYNLGPEKQIGIIDIAEEVCSSVKALYGIESSYLFTSDDSILLNTGMNSQKIYEFLNWFPEYSFQKIVIDTVNELKTRTI